MHEVSWADRKIFTMPYAPERWHGWPLVTRAEPVTPSSPEAARDFVLNPTDSTVNQQQ